MCGIAGFWQTKNSGKKEELEAMVHKMSETLDHRGPDDAGSWVDEKSGLAMGHRRLSILDLSSRGHQPMESFRGRYVIAYNGEIYNFKELRQELENQVRFKTECDTEVILAAISEWGIEEALLRFNGMFAFVLWDKRDKRLFIARDRIGIKPLYYGIQDGVLYFSSELKAIRANPLFKPILDKDALSLFFRYSYIPAPYSVYKNIRKLGEGRYLAVDSDLGIKESCYWDALKITENGIAEPVQGPEEEVVNDLEDLLSDAVGKRMMADVPLGAFLSGGIDSSCVTALMQKQSGVPVKTFTVGFYEDSYNEAGSAGKVARHLGTEHTELYVTPEEIRGVIPRLADMYDEPFSDSSQIPTFLISKLTRNYVTVSLSGDGGDETFGGYNRYAWADRIWGKAEGMPFFAKTAASKVIKSISPGRWDAVSRKASSLMPRIFNHRLFGEKLHKLADVLTAGSENELYRGLTSHWKRPADLVLGAKEPDLALPPRENITGSIPDFAERMMYMDLVTYLPGDILTKVDRASMAVGLEARVPFLDHRIVEFSKRLPISYKIRNGRSKWVLRRILHKYVPEELMDARKGGFGIPIDDWLKGPLKAWAEDLLNEKDMKKDAILDPESVSRMWEQHLSGKKNRHHHLWSVLMFQAWKRRWM